jgi:hypothetical protein
LIFKLVNRSTDRVFVEDGKALPGGKQNRITNATFLVAGLSEIILPVSCVEHGRWAYRTGRFERGRKVVHASLRSGHQGGLRRISLKGGPSGRIRP